MAVNTLPTLLSTSTRDFPGRGGFAAFNVDETTEATQPSKDIINHLCTLNSYTYDQVTLAFSEKTNRWTSFYSFIPENYSSSNTGLLSFRNGNLYKHDDEVNVNNFYGQSYPFAFGVVYNENSTLPKTYRYNTIHSLDPLTTWYVDEEGVMTVSYDFEYKKKERTYYAPIMKDMGTLSASAPNGLAARYTRRDMRDYFLMQHAFSSSGTYNKVMSTSVGYKLSRGHLD